MGAKLPTVEVHDRRDPQASSELEESTVDKSLYYRWVYANQSRIATMKSRGFRYVKRSDGVKTLFEQDDDDGSDTIRHGDRVLMCLPQEEQDKRRKEKLDLRLSRLKRGTNRFLQDARKAGVKVVQGDEED